MNARLVEPQDCPHQEKFIPATPAAATVAGSTSGYAINAFFPPSSSSTGLTVSAAARPTAIPVATLPMTATAETRGSDANSAPTSFPPGITLNTPAGNRPSDSSASRSAETGACSGGLMISELPAASGAAALPAENMRG
ncbi:hypothetical protein G6F68_016090 [Rhizopus microsporus]|nr:hypothetical protein G6F68_016090 [Rhizopus microsporus]